MQTKVFCFKKTLLFLWGATHLHQGAPKYSHRNLALTYYIFLKKTSHTCTHELGCEHTVSVRSLSSVEGACWSSLRLKIPPVHVSTMSTGTLLLIEVG
jgi:hypothetical protein